MKRINTNKLSITDRSNSSIVIVLLVSWVMLVMIPVGSFGQSYVRKSLDMNDLCKSHLLPVNLNRILGIELTAGVGQWYDEEGNAISNIYSFPENAKDYYEFTYKVKNYKSTCINEIDQTYTITINISDLTKPTGDFEQLFCYQPNQKPTIADLQVEGSNIKWYETRTSDQPLPHNYELSNNKTYYATQTKIGCGESMERLEVVVGMDVIPSLSVKDTVERFNHFDLKDLKIEDLNFAEGYVSYYSGFPDTINDINFLLTETIIKESMSLYVLKSTEIGCYDVDSVMVLITAGLEIPRGFSPNNDGINDRFVIKGLEHYPENTLIIANRQGSIVYKKEGYQNDWDGVPNVGMVFGNGKVPEGTYFVVLDIPKEGIVIKDYVYIKY